MKKTKWKFFSSIVLGTVAAISVAGFAPDVGAQKQTPWRHGIVKAKADAGFVYMAQRGGFGKKHGVDIKITQFRSDSTMVRALLAGELDTFEGLPGGTMAAVSRGANIKIIGCQWPGLTYALYVRKDVQRLEDIKGKTIGISRPGSLPDIFARAVLKNAGISVDSVKFANAGGSADRIRALVAGVIDVAPSSSEFAPTAKKLGLRLLVHAQEVVPQFVRFCIMGVDDNLKKKAGQVAAFLAATMEGYKYALTHRDEVIALSMKIGKRKPDDPRPAYIYDEVIKYNSVNPRMEIPLAKIAWLHDTLLAAKKIAKPFDHFSMIDVSYRQSALKLLKKMKKKRKKK